MKNILIAFFVLNLISNPGCEQGPSNLHDAAMTGDTTGIKQFLEQGIRIDAKRDDGRTALHIAAELANIDLAAFLIQRGASINTTDSAGLTPLHVAMGRRLPRAADADVKFNRTRMTQFLLSKGANKEAADSYGWTPLHWAAYWTELGSIDHLCRNEFDVNVRTSRARTLESVVQRYGKSGFFLESIVFPDGSTPLDIIATGCDPCIEIQRRDGSDSYRLLQHFGAIQKTTTGDPFEIHDSPTFMEPGASAVALVVGDTAQGLMGVGKVSVSPSTISDSSKIEIQAVIEANAPVILSCYRRELKTTPGLKGKLSVQIKVNPAGKVAGVSATQNTIGDAVATCVQNKIRGWTFPKAKKGILTINETFLFTK